MKLAPFGDRAIEIEHADVRRVARALGASPIVREVVIGDGALLAHLRDDLTPESLLAIANAIEHPTDDDAAAHSPREHRVRAIYDGPDRHAVAAACGIDVATLAERHAAGAYVVEVIGFLPGFAYLGGLDRSLVVPRRPSPRPRVPAGSIAIAGARTAIYPLDSPGGWSLIARAIDFTPFDPQRVPPTPFSIGDRVRFTIEEVAP